MSRIMSRPPVTPPTLADVAERAGVSRQTVSNAVNNPDLLREDTLQRVQQAITELGYLPNRAARNLRTRASHLIGLPIKAAEEGTANAAMDRFVHSLVDSSREAGYHVLLFSGTRTGKAEDELPAVRRPAPLHRGRRLRGDRHLPRQPAGGLAQRAAGAVRRVRPARGTTPAARHPWVDVDGAAGGDMATSHLIERGHHRIAWIGWRKDSLLGEDRRAGWSQAMRSRDIPTTGLASRVEDTVASGREASAVLLDEAQPTAFVCASDTLAMGVLHTLGRARAARRRGHRGHRLRRLPGRADRAARPDVGAAAARGGGGRGGQGARGPARHAAGGEPGRPAHAHPGRTRLDLIGQVGPVRPYSSWELRIVAAIPAGRLVTTRLSRSGHTTERKRRSRTWNAAAGEEPSTTRAWCLVIRRSSPRIAATVVPRCEATIFTTTDPSSSVATRSEQAIATRATSST